MRRVVRKIPPEFPHGSHIWLQRMLKSGAETHFRGVLWLLRRKQGMVHLEKSNGCVSSLRLDCLLGENSGVEGVKNPLTQQREAKSAAPLQLDELHIRR